MSGSFGTLPSPTAPLNVLANAASGATTAGVQNALYEGQQRQQQIGLTDMDVTSRAAGALYGMPEDQAQAAYGPMIQELRARGFAKNAPDSYPGHAAIGALLQRGMPVETQINTGFLMPPGFAGLPPLPGMPGYGAPGGGTLGQAAPPAAPGVALGMRQNNPGNLEFAGQPGAAPGQGNRFATFPDMPSGVAATANQLAINQQQHGLNTVRGQVTRWVSDPKADLTSYVADISKALGVGPDQPIDFTNPDVQAKFILAQQPHESGGGGAVLDPADVTKGVQQAAAQRGQRVQAPTQTAGGGATPPPYRTASLTPTPPPSAPQGATVADTVGPRPLPPTGPGSPTPPTPQQLANTPYVPPTNALGPQAAPAATPPTQPTQPATQPPIAPQTGINSPQFQMAQQLESQAAQYAAGAKIPGPLGARYAAEAQRLHQLAQLYMQADSVSVDPATGIQTHILTGKQDPSAQPDVKTTMTADGLVVTDPKTGQVLKVIPARPAVSPRSVAGAGPDPNHPGQTIEGHWTIGPSGLQDFVPEATQPAQAPYQTQQTAFKEDKDAIPSIFTNAQTAQSNMLRFNELAKLVPEVQSGGLNGPGRARIASIMEANGFSPAAIQRVTGMPSGSQAEEFNKLAVATIGQAAKGDLGGNVGIQSLELYSHANPGMGLLPDANKRMTNMARVTQQFSQDYANGALQHFNANQDAFLKGQGYAQPLSTYNATWLQRNNPQIGAAAMGILNGDPVSSYANRTSAEERQAAFDMARRIDPTAHMTVKTDTDFAAIPKGASFQAPDGTIRLKP